MQPRSKSSSSLIGLHIRAHITTINAAVKKFWKWSEKGSLPIVIDTSPCTYGLRTAPPYLTDENQRLYDKLMILDSIEFAYDRLLPNLQIKSRVGSTALHPVCSVTKMGIGQKLEAIEKACSHQVLIPQSASCCAFAGKRGLLVPELTLAATIYESAEVRDKHPDGRYSSSRTCEVGMTRATGQIYRLYLYLLEKATRSADDH